jgi:hypothetical protein
MLKKSVAMKALRREMEAGNLYVAALRRAKVAVRTMDTWRKSRPMIERYVEALRSRVRGDRNAIVEDAFFKKLASGKGSAADYTFWLCNKNPDEWKRDTSLIIDQSQHTHLTKIAPTGQPLYKIVLVDAVNRISGNKDE